MPIINETIISGVNAKEATATSADILQGKTAVVGKELITGSMKNNSGKLLTGTFDSGGANFIKGKIAEGGYYDASSILQIPVSNLVSGNIRNGVNIGGVIGNFVGTFTGRYSVSSYMSGKSVESMSVYSPTNGATIHIGGTSCFIAESVNGKFVSIGTISGHNNGASNINYQNSCISSDGLSINNFDSGTLGKSILTRSSFKSTRYNLTYVLILTISIQ